MPDLRNMSPRVFPGSSCDGASFIEISDFQKRPQGALDAAA
jgi:hypothetical protein